MSYNSPTGVTDGLLVPAKVKSLSKVVPLSVGGSFGYGATYQLGETIQDASGNGLLGANFVLTAVAASSGGVAVYTGTITGGATDNFVNRLFYVTGFLKNEPAAYYCTACDNTTLTLANPSAVAETHAAHAGYGAFNAKAYLSRNPSVATVSSSGLITAVAVGQATIEVSYPAFNNALGTFPDTSYIEKIYDEITVQVFV